MHVVILAAGEGRRMGPRADDVPKAFMEVDGRTLYDRQRRALSTFVDETTVVLGYRADEVEDRVDSARVVVVPDWREYDNAESLRRAIEGVDDHVLVLNGDVVVTRAAIECVDRCHDSGEERSVAAALPGIQTEHTAVATDGDGTVTDYGMIEGYRHAGLGVIDRTDLGAAGRCLRRHREEWYPVVYPELGARVVPLPSEHHVEFNRPRDCRDARGRLPIETPVESDPRA